jgi:prepilin signal peptidase PulO-like enzyme (type II secretory pathway)
VVAPDPLVQGLCALTWALAALTLPGDPARWVMVGLLAVPLVQVGSTDFRSRYVYTVVAGVGVAIGLAFGWQVHNSPWWTSIAGAVGAYAAFALFYLLAALIYRSRAALYRGDMTIAAMIGAGAAVCTPQALFGGILIGGVLGIVYWVVKRSRYASMPYGPGLCLGGLVALFFC